MKKWGKEMKKDEMIKLILKLTEENARYKAALKNLETKIKNYKEGDSDRKALLDEAELTEVLEIAGMTDKEVNAIYYDNCKEVAYEP